jgi:hypothetical protein
VCRLGVVPRVGCPIDEEPTGTEERDEDEIESSFGLCLDRDKMDTEGTGDGSNVWAPMVLGFD